MRLLRAVVHDGCMHGLPLDTAALNGTMAMNLSKYWHRGKAATAIILAATLALSGCNEPQAPTDVLTPETASRFLHQATFGANEAEINNLMSLGYESWVQDQFTQVPSDTYWDYVDRGGPPGCSVCDAMYQGAVQEAFWYQVVHGKAQLRQRTAFALSQLFVVSGTANSTLRDQELSIAAFQTMLMGEAFSNFRVILEKVALHPTMGVFLSHLGNEKEDAATGRLPDENFAREIMQLFTIGKWQLNQDGSRLKDGNGNDIPTYSQDEIMGMAKVFTGWGWNGSDTSEERWKGYSIGAEDPRTWNQQMQPYGRYHSVAEKKIINGVVIPANATPEQSVQLALDALFNHPNLPPLVATHLIKRFVTSNPSPAYVNRVANVFSMNNQGVRGDMKAVVRAVLFDPEARDIAMREQESWGKLREPVIRMANHFRAFNVRSARQAHNLERFDETPKDIGQVPWMAPTVFNFFTPDHQPPGVLADNNLTAPEFQVFDEATSVGYANYMQHGLEHHFGTWPNNIFVYDYSKELALAGKPAELVSRIALLLNGGYMSANTRSLIEHAINSIEGTTNEGKLKRVRTAIFMVLVSPDYLIQK